MIALFIITLIASAVWIGGLYISLHEAERNLNTLENENMFLTRSRLFVASSARNVTYGLHALTAAIPAGMIDKVNKNLKKDKLQLVRVRDLDNKLKTVLDSIADEDAHAMKLSEAKREESKPCTDGTGVKECTE